MWASSGRVHHYFSRRFGKKGIATLFKRLSCLSFLPSLIRWRQALWKWQIQELSSLVGKCQFWSWDAIMRQSWNGLKVPSFVGEGGIKMWEDWKNVKWHPPNSGWFKVNFDGASRGNPRWSRAGCIIISHYNLPYQFQQHCWTTIYFSWNQIMCRIETIKYCGWRGLDDDRQCALNRAFAKLEIGGDVRKHYEAT